jgi:alpha-aminoadipic semialdehyde synthase
MMFSHTAKGQPYNLPLLSCFLTGDSHEDKKGLLPRLIDYELLTDNGGKRTVGFGWFAGG